MNALDHPSSLLNKIQSRALIVGVLASSVCVIGAMRNLEQFFQSYLLAFLFWFGIAAGCLAWIMLHHLVGGGWGFVIQRLLESGSRTLPLMLVLFFPLYFGMQELYLWARPEAVRGDELLQHKSGFLNVPFFWARALVYFGIWFLFTYLLNKWSTKQDQIADPSLTKRLANISGPGLVLFVLTMTLAAIDWVMSLDPHWYSTIFGILFVVGEGLATLAFVIILLKVLAEHKPLSEVISSQHFHDLGNLMLAFVMLWAYVAFSQFLIIWSGNLPEEISWYLHRFHGGWQWLAYALLIFHFALPFVLLLSRKAKRKAQVLSKLAAAMIVMRFLDLLWIVVPNFHPEKFRLDWMDLFAPVGMGGIWMAYFIWQLKGRALLPLRDPRLKAALPHE